MIQREALVDWWICGKKFGHAANCLPGSQVQECRTVRWIGSHSSLPAEAIRVGSSSKLLTSGFPFAPLRWSQLTGCHPAIRKAGSLTFLASSMVRLQTAVELNGNERWFLLLMMRWMMDLSGAAHYAPQEGITCCLLSRVCPRNPARNFFRSKVSSSAALVPELTTPGHFFLSQLLLWWRNRLWPTTNIR